MLNHWRRRHHDDTETALANFALTLAKALLVFCVILFVMIADVSKKTDGVRPKVEAMIMVDWPKAARVDVDTWVRNADGGIVYYGNKEAGIVFLDRDDLGDACIAICEEITSLRGLNAGDYVLNLNVYADRAITLTSIPTEGAPLIALHEPLSVHVRIMQMNPVVQTVFEQDLVLHYLKEEKPVVRFSVIAGKLVQFDTAHPIMLQKHL